MKRLAAVAAGVTLLLSTGCHNNGDWSVQKALGLSEPDNRVKMPDPKALPPASMKAAARVEENGRKILAQNMFNGLDPELKFMTTGVKESVLFHLGSDQLYISEGLAEKCATEAELSAVLCSELGLMIAEQRSAKAVGRDVDPIPDPTTGTGPLFPGGTAVDAGQMANLAYHEKKYPRGAASRPDQADAANIARDLLKGAGYSPAELDRVESLLKQSKRGAELQKQMGGSAPEPKWEK
jgi:hypothetical protein